MTLEIKEDDVISDDLLFVGRDAAAVIKAKRNSPVVTKFLTRARDAKYMQKKLPLDNKILRRFASIDPQVIMSRSETVLSTLLKLPDYINALDGEKQREEYEQEARSLMGSQELPALEDDDGNGVKCFDWWIQVSTKYPLVFKIVTAILSNFCGPKVESSFSVMGEVVDKKSGSMNIETYSTIQTIKYELKVKVRERLQKLLNGDASVGCVPASFTLRIFYIS